MTQEEDDSCKVLHKYGWYQRRLVLLITFPLILSGANTMMVVLTFTIPSHRCSIPELPNDTYAIRDDHHRQMVNLSIPITDSEYAKCSMYKDRDPLHTNRSLYGDTESCQSWVYDKSEMDNTMATEFDLVCDDKGFRATFNSMYMLGKLFLSPLLGYACDRFGRRVTFFFCLLALIAVGLASSFPGIPEMLQVYRFFNGGLGQGMYLALYVLSLESMGPKQRTFVGTMMMALWLLGPIVAGLVSYLIWDWRWLQVAIYTPFILCVSYWWLLPESPRWLLTRGREKEANDILRKVVRTNGLEMPACLQQADGEKGRGRVGAGKYATEMSQTAGTGVILTGVEKTDGQNSKKGDTDVKNGGDKTNGTAGKEAGEEQRESLRTVLKYPNYIVRLLIIFFNWAVTSMTYYGLSLNVENLPGNLRTNFLLSNVVEFVGYMLVWPLMNKVGRKHTHCAVMLLAGISCLATIFTVTMGGSELQWLTTTLAMIGKLAISAAFSTIYLLSGELLPTVYRNFGMGCCSMTARVGGAVSPYIADLALHIDGKFAQALPLTIFGAVGVVAGILALFLPETLNRKLPATIQEAAKFTRKKSDDERSVDDLKPHNGRL